MKHFLTKPYILTIAGVIVGASGGFLYWYYVGCASGSCSITSVWYNSTAYGALMGGLAFSNFSSGKEK